MKGYARVIAEAVRVAAAPRGWEPPDALAPEVVLVLEPGEDVLLIPAGTWPVLGPGMPAWERALELVEDLGG